MLGQMRQCSQHDSDEQNRQDCDGPPLPALLAFARDERNASSTMIPIAGPMSKMGVSADGGRNDSNAYSHRKKKSGRGEV